MEFILKAFGPTALLALLPMILIKVGNYFKNKDADNVGPDDAFGNVCLAAAPAFAAATDGDGKALKKALRLVRDTIDGYLGEK